MAAMSDKQVREFLSHGTRTGKLATIRKDGSPHVTPIWFVLDGDELLFTTARESVKGRNVARDPRVAIAVDDQSPPYAYVRISGEAKTSDNLDQMLIWATKIGGRYMGAQRATEFGERNAVPEEMLVRVVPTRVTGESGVAD